MLFVTFGQLFLYILFLRLGYLDDMLKNKKRFSFLKRFIY